MMTNQEWFFTCTARELAEAIVADGYCPCLQCCGQGVLQANNCATEALRRGDMSFCIGNLAVSITEKPNKYVPSFFETMQMDRVALDPTKSLAEWIRHYLPTCDFCVEECPQEQVKDTRDVNPEICLAMRMKWLNSERTERDERNAKWRLKSEGLTIWSGEPDRSGNNERD